LPCAACHVGAGAPDPFVASVSGRVGRRRCGFAGCRVGEASNPGPPSPGTPLGGERQPMAVDASGSSGRERSPPPGQRSPDRVFCPVPGCPASMPGSRGWTSHAAMRPHLEDHAAGTLDGDVPQAYRARQHLDLCSVCGGLVSSRYDGAHPRCRPAARRAAAAALPLLPPQSPALLWRQPALQTPRSCGMSPKLPGPFGPNAFHGPLRKSPALTVCKLGGISSCCPRPCSAPLLVAGAGTACKQPSSLSVVVPVGWPENAKSCGMPCLPLAANGLRRWMMRKPGQPGRAAAAHWPPRASFPEPAPP
jgi:hypothetical protein